MATLDPEVLLSFPSERKPLRQEHVTVIAVYQLFSSLRNILDTANWSDNL